MNQLPFDEWVLKPKSELTRQVYKKIQDNGWKNRCDCMECRNIQAAGDSVYPKLILDLFNKLGIDYRFPAETYHNCRTKPGFHHYGGWFHYIGEFHGRDIREKANQGSGYNLIFKEVVPTFSIGFSSEIDLLEPAFNEVLKNNNIVQVSFFNELVPWVIHESEPE